MAETTPDTKPACIYHWSYQDNERSIQGEFVRIEELKGLVKRLEAAEERRSRHHMEMVHQMALNAAMQAQVDAFREALSAERAYQSNNTGKNAARRKAAMAALGKAWEK